MGEESEESGPEYERRGEAGPSSLAVARGREVEEKERAEEEEEKKKREKRRRENKKGVLWV